MIRMVAEDSSCTRIAVVGVGGAGGAVLNALIETGMKRIGTILVATDDALLERSGAMERILIGREITSGRGCGGEPEIGRRAALQDIDLVREAIEEYDAVVLIAGLGGGTGTGALPEIASMIRDLGKRAISMVMEPLPYEGRRRGETARGGLASLRSAPDSVVSIKNASLLSSVEDGVTLVDAFFEHVNGKLCSAVRSLVKLLGGGGIVNVDFADIRSVLSTEGHAAIAHGHGSGKKRALDAVSSALSSPIIESSPFSEAGAALVCFEGSSCMTFRDVDQALERIAESACPGADILVGAFVNEEMGDSCTITIIYTCQGGQSDLVRDAEDNEEPVTWQPGKAEQTVIDFSPPERGRFTGLEPSLYEGEDLDIPTILRTRAR